MARPSVIPEVRVRLEAYLNEQEAAYQSRPEEERRPTLPALSDGKVNVRAIAQAIGLKQTQEKYLFEREELSSLVNLMAEGQGLAPIGARVSQDASDKAIRQRSLMQAQAVRAATQAATEAVAQHGELMEIIKQQARDIQSLKAENMRLRSRLELIESGIFAPDLDEAGHAGSLL
jgi:hypothetical protein